LKNSNPNPNPLWLLTNAWVSANQKSAPSKYKNLYQVSILPIITLAFCGSNDQIEPHSTFINWKLVVSKDKLNMWHRDFNFIDVYLLKRSTSVPHYETKGEMTKGLRTATKHKTLND